MIPPYIKYIVNVKVILGKSFTNKSENSYVIWYDYFKERRLFTMRANGLRFTLKMPKKFDFFLQFSVLILIMFGTLMIISTNVGNTSNDSLVLIKVILKQSVFVVISYCLMTFFANNFTMRRAQKILPFLFVAIFVLLLSTQFFEAVNGSKAWIQIPLPAIEVTIQPSEFAKVFIVVALAVYVEVSSHKNLYFWQIVRIPLIMYLAISLAIIFQKDLGTFAVITVLCITCFLIPSHINIRAKQRYLKIAMLIGCVLLLFVMSEQGLKMMSQVPFLGHVAIRIENAINPFLAPHDNGYQLINGLYGFARGGLTGVGLGNSIQKYGYLTQSDNDFILSIIVEELGVFGLAIVVLGYGMIVQRLFYYAFHTSSEGYKLILIGNALYIFIHFMFNVGGVSGLIPLTGVPLLFISSGGSSLMAIMSAIGISQAIISRIRRQRAT